MKNALLLLALISLFNFHSFSQDNGFVALNIGPCIPLDNFASKDAGNSKAGFATAAWSYDVSAGYKLGKILGLSVMIRRQNPGFDVEPLVEALQDGIPQYGWVGKVDKSWRFADYMIGAYASFPVGKKEVKFDLRAMTGYTQAESPGYTITAATFGVVEWIKQYDKKAGTISYLLGSGFRFKAGKRICVRLNADWFFCKPEFRNVTVTSSFDTPQTGLFTQSVSFLTLGFGLGIRL